jgi:hypothetical protein
VRGRTHESGGKENTREKRGNRNSNHRREERQHCHQACKNGKQEEEQQQPNTAPPITGVKVEKHPWQYHGNTQQERQQKEQEIPRTCRRKRGAYKPPNTWSKLSHHEAMQHWQTKARLLLQEHVRLMHWDSRTCGKGCMANERIHTTYRRRASKLELLLNRIRRSRQHRWNGNACKTDRNKYGAFIRGISNVAEL